MKEFIAKYGGWICTGILIAVIIFMATGKSSDFKKQEAELKTIQHDRDSMSVIIDIYSKRLVSKELEIDTLQNEADSIYSLYLEANNKLIYVYQSQRKAIRTDNIGSDSLRSYFSKLPR